MLGVCPAEGGIWALARPRCCAMKRCVWVSLIGLCVGCGQAPGGTPPATPSPQGSAQRPASPAERLTKARSLEQRSEYAKAEQAYVSLLGTAVGAEAAVGLARVLLVTGRYDDAIERARSIESSDAALVRQALHTQAAALRAKGDLGAAEAVLLPKVKDPAARRLRLLLGEILLERGKRDAAEPYLMTLIEDYNSDHIKNTDGEALAMVGRAAHLLRSPRDANDAFNLSEQAGKAQLQTLLWRAELFLEKHDPGHAEAVVREALEQAPNHPDALVWLARVRLEQAYDFDGAERQVRHALSVNPKHSGAHAVLAGISLKDMELEEADRRINDGLQARPVDLELLSLRAATRFLADDRAGFEKATKAVLTQSPGYSRVYQIVGDFAEWEHRYTDIVEMMEEAVRIDPGDANAHASLGLNLIRAGEDDAGIISLRTAFELDPFNVRVFNTLNLYEKAIPNEYVDVERGRFKIRYPKAEKELLDRYIPGLLDQAFEKMVEHYGFEPQLPIGIELYASREHFSVRTSGLPRTAIQGVCFGKTLASMSLAEEKFNLGMTLWHELAHVFHIQLSKYHVPRWFTEGLAEYETLIERPEWSRENDPDLFEALRGNRIPEVGNMSRAFTRAEQMSDVATAYYASSKILTMLVEHYSMPKMREMLQRWGEGMRSDAVVQNVLGTQPKSLDSEFRQYTRAMLARYDSQFVPVQRPEAPDRLQAALKQTPDDPGVLLKLARSVWQQGEVDRAEAVLNKVLEATPDQPDALYLAAEVALEKREPERGQKYARRLVELKRDGYWTELLLAQATIAEKQADKAREALERAHGFDPTQAEPLTVLVRLARAADDKQAELDALLKLALLEQHSGEVYARLFQLFDELERHADIVKWGQAALWADLSNFEIHYLLAKALQAQNQPKQAIFEFESAMLCDAPEPRKAEATASLLEAYKRAGLGKKARELTEKLRAAAAAPASPE